MGQVFAIKKADKAVGIRRRQFGQGASLGLSPGPNVRFEPASIIKARISKVTAAVRDVFRYDFPFLD